MTVHHLTPPGRIPDEKIDALLDQYAPDEWLPDALKAPLQIGFFACAAGLPALAIQAVFPTWREAAIALWAIWLVLVPFSIGHMVRLGRIRQRETLTRRRRAQ